MQEGEVIDKLYDDLYKRAMDPKYEFVKYAASWGRKYSPDYNHKKVQFSKMLRLFAQECGIMSRDDDFYIFTGTIYEKTTQFSVEQAFDRLMEGVGIAEMMNNRTMRREVFMGTILAYNQLDVRNDLRAFSNKIVKFSPDGYKAYDPSPKFHVIDYHPYPFVPDYPAPTWNAFLHEVLPSKRDRDVLQMFLGLGLVQTSDAFNKHSNEPRGTVELCLLLLGSGANGKSVLFNVICAVFGKSHITSLDYDVLTADGDEGMRGRYPIRSAIFNWSSDSDPKKFGKKNTAMFKRIVSGEPVPIRGIRKDIQENPNCPYLIFSLNELPTPEDQSRGFMRRLQYINFNVTIPRSRQNPNLAGQIIRNDLPGVFNWVLRGAREIQRRHFQFPNTETTRKQLIKTIMDANPCKAWMIAYDLRSESHGHDEVEADIMFSNMYDSLTQFCKDNNLSDEDIPSNLKLSRELTNNGFMRRRKKEGVFYTCYGCDENMLKQRIFIENISEPELRESEQSFIKYD